MASQMNKTAMNKKLAETNMENIVFEPIVILVKDISTSIHLLSCQEENVILAALISLDRYIAKSTSHLDVILQKGLKPKDLLSLAFEGSSLPPSSSVRRFAAKLLTRMVKIPKIRESLPRGTSYCLASLQRDDGDPMNEFASNILAELTRGTSVSYAASLLISPPLKQDHPLKILFTRLISTTDPDVIHNCLRNIWQLLIAASAAPKKRHYVSVIDQHLNLAALPPLFQSNYPSIQLISMAVAYEVAIRSPETQTTLSTCFPSLLTLLESPSDRVLHRTVLALLCRLICPQPMEGQTTRDSAIPLVAADGPARLLKYLSLQEMETGDLRFWPYASTLALFSSPSAAYILINHHQFHRTLPSLLNNEKSKVAVAAANAICSLEYHPNALEEIAKSQAPQHLAELAARWPGDEAIPLDHRQTYDGCCVAARALERLVRDYPIARTSLTYETADDSVPDRTFAGGMSATSTAQPASEKVSQALYCLQEVLERVGKLPEECISSVLGTVATLASDEKLRLALISTEGIVSAVTNCLDAPSYHPPDPEPPELPVAWPQTSDALECVLVERFSRECIWDRKNQVSQFSDSPLGVKEAACIALGTLMLESSATETFVSMNGAEIISRLLKEEESGLERDSMLEKILFLIANCPKRVAHALIRNGTLQWMMKEGASRFLSTTSTSWHTAIVSLLRSNPSVKYQITGCLNPDDDSGDLFYVVCPPPKHYSSFKTIDEYCRRATKPHRHVFVACWSSYKSLTEKDRFYRSQVRKQESFVSKQKSHDALDVDVDLLTFETSLKEELKGSRFGAQEMVRAIAQLVSEIMAGPVQDSEFQEQHLEQLKIEVRQGDVIPLGRVRMGGFTERAILFKVLADRLGLPVALVRGAYGRSWVEISLVEVPEISKSKEQENQEEDASESKGKSPEARLDIPLAIIRPSHVIDLITKPGYIYPIGSIEANLYCGYELNGSEGRMSSPFHSLGEGEDNLESKGKTMRDTENEDEGYKAEDDDGSENEVEVENEDNDALYCSESQTIENDKHWSEDID